MATKKKSTADLEAEIARLKAEVRDAKAAAKAEFKLSVSAKGAVSLYGHGQRFPTTLYADQWEFVLDHAKEIREFLARNQGSLKGKRGED